MRLDRLGLVDDSLGMERSQKIDFFEKRKKLLKKARLKKIIAMTGGLMLIFVIVGIILFPLFQPRRYLSVIPSECRTMAIVRVDRLAEMNWFQRNASRYERWIDSAVIDVRTGEEIIPFRTGPFMFFGEYVFIDWYGILHIETGEKVYSLDRYRAANRVDDIQYGMIIELSSGFGPTNALIALESGEEIIPFNQYNRISFLNSEMILVRNELLRDHPHPYRGNFLNLYQGVVNIHSGVEIIPIGMYDSVHHIGEGMVVVRLNEAEGLIDVESGEEVIPIGKYDVIRHIDQGRVVVVLNDAVALIDVESGEEIIPIGLYDNIRHIGEGMVVVQLNETEGLIDIESGEEIIPIGRYSRIRHIGEGMIVVQLNGTEGLVDIERGNEIIPNGYFASIRHIGEGLVIAYDLDWNIGMIELETGYAVIPFGRYHDIMPFADGVVAVRHHLETVLRESWSFIHVID